jgi:hypothetical protein
MTSINTRVAENIDWQVATQTTGGAAKIEPPRGK